MIAKTLLLPLLSLAPFYLAPGLEAAPLQEREASPSSQPSPENPGETPGQEKKPSEADTHVQALLERMLAKDSFLLRARYKVDNPFSKLPLPGLNKLAGKGKKKVEVLQTHLGTLDQWSEKGQKFPLFRKGTNWALPMEGTYALAPDRKQSPDWNQKLLPDGVLLAKALRYLLPLSRWKDLGSDTFDDRPVLVWRCRLEGKAARLFHATRMTPISGNFAFGMMLLVNLPGMQKKPLDLHVEITLYEDPGHKLPIRATIRTFLPRKGANAQGGVIIQIGGGNQGNDDDDEEEDKEKPEPEGETKTHRLAGSLELLFSRWGRVKNLPLPKEARKVLR